MMLSMNQNITWEIVQANPDEDWNYQFLSKNPNITWEIVRSYPDEDWNYLWLSNYNANINWQIIEDNHDKCYYRGIYINPMPLWKNEYIRKCYQKHFMSSGIAEELISVVWHPRNFERFKYLDPETFGEEF